MFLRTWQYTAMGLQTGGVSGRYTINENLTGAVLGSQRPARINFRTALLIVSGWNQLSTRMRYRLVIPNPKN